MCGCSKRSPAWRISLAQVRATVDARCAVCPHRRACAPPLDDAGTPLACPRRYFDRLEIRLGTPRVRWLGVVWRGVPKPVRWWLRWRGVPRATIDAMPGCGCVEALKRASEKWTWPGRR